MTTRHQTNCRGTSLGSDTYLATLETTLPQWPTANGNEELGKRDPVGNTTSIRRQSRRASSVRGIEEG